ncbi:MAG: Bro-N domain-containing protein [Burkholderiaceae bacterium]
MKIEVVVLGSDLWFCAALVAQTLGYMDLATLLTGMKSGETCKLQKRIFLSEWGLCRAIINSSAEIAEPYRRWVVGEVVPRLRKTGLYGLHDEAQRLGVTFDFTAAQWEWLRSRPEFVALLPLAAAGYNSVEITRILKLHTSTGITARKRIDRLKELGFLPQKIEPHFNQVVRLIEAEQAAKAAV